MSRALSIPMLFVLAFGLFAGSAAHARDDDYQRLSDRLDLLAGDPVLGTKAPAQIERARMALAQLKEARRSRREHWIYVSERRIEIARAVAETGVLEARRYDLQRDNDRLQLALARRDAEMARAELEQQRLQAQIRAEEAERMQQEAEAARAEGEQATQAARAEADQAKRMAAAQARATALAKKEAELAAALGSEAAAPASKAAASPPQVLELSAGAFVNGKAAFAPGASRQIDKAVTFANTDRARRIRIEVAAADRNLAQQRANAIRDSLVAAGVSTKRLTAKGSVSKTERAQIVLETAKP